MAKVLQHRDYFKIAENNIENIRSDIWDLVITNWPLAVYNPGLELLKTRLITVAPGVETSFNLISKEVNGHTVQSPGSRGATKASSTYTFNDREDSAVTFMINDYLNQCGDPDTGFGRHKTELLMESDLVFYNTLLKQTRKLTFYAGLYGGASLPEDTGNRGDDMSGVSLTMNFEHHKRFIL